MEKLEPGRELDALVATEVMHQMPPTGSHYCKEDQQWEDWRPADDPDDRSWWLSTWPACYSTDIAAAMEVAAKFEYMELKGPFDRDNNGMLYMVFLKDAVGDRRGQARGLTASHAICIAALKAKGHPSG